MVPLLQPQLHFQPPLFFLLLQLFVAESVDSAPLVLLQGFQRRCLLQPPLQPLPPLPILPPYFLQLFILKLLQSLGRLDLHRLQYLDAAGLLAILQGPVGPESPPLRELRRVLRHLDAARDLHSLEPKELILFVFDEIGQLIEGLYALEQSAANRIADPQIGNAAVRIDLVEVLEQRSNRTLGVLQLQLVLQPQQLLLDVLVVPAELVSKYRMEAAFDAPLLLVEWGRCSLGRRRCCSFLLLDRGTRRPALGRLLRCPCHVCQGPRGLRSVGLVIHLRRQLLLLLHDGLTLLHDFLYSLELLNLLGLEILLVLGQLIDLLLVLEELLRLLFLYLVEVARYERRWLSLLLVDLLLVEALGLVHDGHLSDDLALQGVLFHCYGSLHSVLLPEGPRLGRHLSLLPRDLVIQNVLGGHLSVRSLRCHLHPPRRRRRDLESYILTRLAHVVRQGRVLRVLHHLLR